ncbi:hypothetical protein GCM10017044_25750 [Kordiimonas sediminis]|uniref:Magnesium transporter MgtE intracellular domain-containing protein n=1 Tax=Kordiimonas sediminis TaxID=1735581 RepID=A0A919AWI1_9PROT|nr:hypothetical protein [Kordiimonas sediminis]GHF29349.1 hypothetical protein GCM10017044_25750 [Kordiimonas sediminis]
MAEMVKRNFRLFPIVIGVAFLALALHAVSLVTGYEELVAARAIAAEAQAAEDQEAAEQTADGTATADTADQETADGGLSDPLSGPTQPLMIGVPTSEEMELITQLRKRREELDQRAVQLDMQEQLLAGTEKRINDKISQLSALESKIKEHLGVFDEREKEQLRSIVAVYEKMKAKDAAPRFEALDLDIQVDLVSMMKPAKVADLMSKMSPVAAQKLTTELATVAQPPKIDDVESDD